MLYNVLRKATISRNVTAIIVASSSCVYHKGCGFQVEVQWSVAPLL